MTSSSPLLTRWREASVLTVLHVVGLLFLFFYDNDAESNFFSRTDFSTNSRTVSNIADKAKKPKWKSMLH